jgi:hypothetical protein
MPFCITILKNCKTGAYVFFLVIVIRIQTGKRKPELIGNSNVCRKLKLPHDIFQIRVFLGTVDIGEAIVVRTSGDCKRKWIRGRGKA